jgi:hypothetical protein
LLRFFKRRRLGSYKIYLCAHCNPNTFWYGDAPQMVFSQFVVSTTWKRSSRRLAKGRVHPQARMMQYGRHYGSSKYPILEDVFVERLP